MQENTERATMKDAINEILAAAKPTSASSEPSKNFSESHVCECGLIRIVLGYRDGEPYQAPCRECQPLEYEQALRAQELIIRQRKINWEIKSSGLTARFRQCNFENYILNGNPEQAAIKKCCQKFAGNFKQHLEQGTSLVLLGNTGTGKTHLAAAIANQVMADLAGAVCAVKWPDFVKEIKYSWNRSAERPGRSEEEIIEAARGCDLLCLDDLGVWEKSNPAFEKALLYDVVDNRYECLKPTIITTNLSKRDLGKVADARVISRFHQPPSRILAFSWDDYRRPAK